MPKYTPEEWLQHIQTPARNDGTWFTQNYDLQDRIMLDVAVQIYCAVEDITHEDAIEEASAFLRAFYNHRYNPKTRKQR